MRRQFVVVSVPSLQTARLVNSDRITAELATTHVADDRPRLRRSLVVAELNLRQQQDNQSPVKNLSRYRNLCNEIQKITPRRLKILYEIFILELNNVFRY